MVQFRARALSGQFVLRWRQLRARFYPLQIAATWRGTSSPRSARAGFYDLGRTDGREPGLVWVDWYQNLIPLGEDVSDLLHLFMFPTRADGTPMQSSMAAGSDQSFVGVNGTYGFDRSLADLYNIAPGATLLAVSGPHRNEYDNIDRSNSDDPAQWVLDSGWPIATYLIKSGETPSPAALGRENTREAYATVASNPLVVAEGFQMQNLECWGDTQHTAATSNGLSEDGDWLWEASLSWNIANFFGLNSHFARADQPVISQATYHSDYIEVEFSDETGPVNITTTRAARGEAQEPGRPDHHADVAGFSVLGHPVKGATLVDGRVRIAPLGGAPTVTANDGFLEFGRGAGGGQLGALEDISMRLWKNFPGIEKPSMPENAEGKILVPAIARGKAGEFPVTNNLGDALGTSVRSDATTQFSSVAPLSNLLYGMASAQEIVVPEGTIEVVCSIPNTPETSGSYFLYRMSGGGSFLRFTPWNGRVMTGGEIGFVSTGNNGYTEAVEQSFKMSWSASRGAKILAAPNETVPGSYTGEGEPLNILDLLVTGSITGIEFRSFKFWDRVVTNGEDNLTGDAPSDVPLITISGGPGYTNRHPFHVGAQFT